MQNINMPIDKTMDLLICLPMTPLAYKLLDQALNQARESITESVNELINLSNDRLAQLKKVKLKTISDGV